MILVSPSPGTVDPLSVTLRCEYPPCSFSQTHSVTHTSTSPISSVPGVSSSRDTSSGRPGPSFSRFRWSLRASDAREARWCRTLASGPGPSMARKSDRLGRVVRSIWLSHTSRSRRSFSRVFGLHRCRQLCSTKFRST